jgi:NAD+ kinase
MTVEVHPGYEGFEVEIDGQRRVGHDLRFRLSLHPDKLTLVAFGPSGRGLTGLRQRRLIADSPRVLARDARAGR